MKYIPIENWDVSNVTTFSHMFADCYSLQSIDFSKWETSSVKSFNALLNDCRSLTVIDVTGLDTSTCEQFSQMFESCTSLERIIGLETWDVSNASYYAFSEIFHCCYKLKELNISSWFAKPDNTARMFKNCYMLAQIDMSYFDMTNIQTVTEMFMNCWNLTEVMGMKKWDVRNVPGYETMYIGSGLK
jgi:surface protein